MNLFDRFSNVLRQLDRAIRARGLRHTIQLALQVLLSEGIAGIHERLNTLGPSLRPARPSGPQSALVLTTPHTLHFARRFVSILIEAGYEAELSDSDRDAKDFKLIIAFAPHAFPKLPLNRSIAFQIEPHIRSDRWTSDYLKRLAQFRAVFDYSTENIERLRNHIPLRQLFYVPFSPCSTLVQDATTRRSVLFYGDASTPRRKSILEYLRKRIPELEVETNSFGSAIDARLAQAAIVVNLHAVDGTVLETARISEALAAGAVVVSETASDQNDHPDIISRITLVPEGDTEALADKIRTLIDNPMEMLAARRAIAEPIIDRFRLFALRALQGVNLITPERFEALATEYPSPISDQPLDVPHICLTLPETPIRTRSFQAKNDSFSIWPGMKADPGWRGCALSYRHLMRILYKSGTKEALIVEDDVVLPEDFAQRLTLARRVMDQKDADMFSGMIVDLHHDTQVFDVQNIDGVTFVTLDRAVMTICNLYRPRMIKWMSDWDDNDSNVFTNTIDRYMQRATHLRVVTTLPFTVTYQREATSTLRESGNDRFDMLLERSVNRLEEKVGEFKARHTG